MYPTLFLETIIEMPLALTINKMKNEAINA